MCLICIDIQKDKLTSYEARRNLEETHETMTKEHIFEVLKIIWHKEDQEQKEMWNQHAGGNTD
jgi:hypothetical protein